MLKANQCHKFPAVVSKTGFAARSVVLPRRGNRSTYGVHPVSVSSHVARKNFKCAAEAESPNETPSSTNVLDYILGRGNYQLLTAVYSVFAVAFVFAAPIVSDKIVGVALAPVSELLMRASGAMILVPAAIAYCMQSAVATDRLESPTFKRLSFSLALTLAAVFVAKCIMTPKGVVYRDVYTWVISAAHLLPTVAFVKLYGISLFSDIITGIISGVKSVFQPDSVVSGVYSVLTTATMVFGSLALFIPERMNSWIFTFACDAVCTFRAQSLGALTILTSITLFTLKDAADRNRLGFETARTLNAAVSIASLAKFASTWYVCEMASRQATAAGADVVCMMTTAGGLTTMGISLALAVFCGFHAVMAKKE